MDHIILGRGLRFFLLPENSALICSPPCLPLNGNGGDHYQQLKRLGVELIRHIQPVPCLNIGGNLLVLPLYAFTEWTRKTIAFKKKCSQFAPPLMFAGTSSWCFLCILFNKAVSILTIQRRRWKNEYEYSAMVKYQRTEENRIPL